MEKNELKELIVKAHDVVYAEAAKVMSPAIADKEIGIIRSEALRALAECGYKLKEIIYSIY